MNLNALASKRLNGDPEFATSMLELKCRYLEACNICGHTGVVTMPSGRRGHCKCMTDFIMAKSLSISRVPLEAMEVLDMISAPRRGLTDLEYKRTVLSINRHEIHDINNRKKRLYEHLINPYIENAARNLLNGASLVLFGTNSRGKTWALYYLAIHLIKKYSCFFTSLDELIKALNAADYDRVSDRASSISKAERETLVSILHGVDFLFIDEASKLSSFTDNVKVKLEGFLKARGSARKPFIMVSNHTPSDFHTQYGPQVVSAVLNRVYVAHILSGPDMRKQAMKKSNIFSFVG